jgi:2-succinyl-6-hydroxy-2,4-cyclohexadiene-1-carboxylate synthase
MPTTKVNGIDIYFERHGDAGEPLVLVHGYTGDVSDWRHQIPEFSRTHRVLVMDHRGHGRSHAPADRAHYTIEAMADDVEALIDDVGFERYHLLGHSMGGCVAQEITLRSTPRLLSLTLHDTNYRFAGLNAAIANYIAMRHKVAEEQGMAAVADLPNPLPTPPHMPAERKQEEKERLSRMSVDAFIGAWNALGAWRGVEDRAHEIDLPTMIIYGALDAPFAEPAKWFASKIANSIIEVVPEAGHSPQFERPDLFNAALRRHLDRHAAAPSK